MVKLNVAKKLNNNCMEINTIQSSVRPKMSIFTRNLGFI